MMESADGEPGEGSVGVIVNGVVKGEWLMILKKVFWTLHPLRNNLDKKHKRR